MKKLMTLGSSYPTSEMMFSERCILSQNERGFGRRSRLLLTRTAISVPANEKAETERSAEHGNGSAPLLAKEPDADEAVECR